MSESETIKKTAWFLSTTKPGAERLLRDHWLIGSHSVLRCWDGSYGMQMGKSAANRTTHGAVLLALAEIDVADTSPGIAPNVD